MVSGRIPRRIHQALSRDEASVADGSEGRSQLSERIDSGEAVELAENFR